MTNPQVKLVHRLMRGVDREEAEAIVDKLQDGRVRGEMTVEDMRAGLDGRSRRLRVCRIT